MSRLQLPRRGLLELTDDAMLTMVCGGGGRRCAVFGRAVGAAIPVGRRDAGSSTEGAAATETEGVGAAAVAARSITAAELATHNTADSCWVSIDQKVYDFTEFLDEHPAGAQSILDYGGQDGTVVFDTIHSRSMLDDFEPIGACTSEWPFGTPRAVTRVNS